MILKRVIRSLRENDMEKDSRIYSIHDHREKKEMSAYNQSLDIHIRSSLEYCQRLIAMLVGS